MNTLLAMDTPHRKAGRPGPTLPTPPSVTQPSLHINISNLSTRDKFLRFASKYRRNKYLHRPLSPNNARLLIVEPRNDLDDEIFVGLVEIPFSELGTKYQYEALSYHWGDGEAERPIHVRNNSKSTTTLGSMHRIEDVVSAAAINLIEFKQFWVKPNLYSALHHLRYQKEKLTIWVDAMCINQDNLVEKQQQVGRMSEIYSRASSVIVWLGNSDPRTKNAMRFIKEIIDLESLKTLITDDSKTSDWRDLMHLMRSSWFSRRWVIQELALAQDATVHCGEDPIHWFDFRDAISLFAHNFDTIRTSFKRSKEFDYDFNAMGELEPLGAKVLVDTINNIFRKNESAGRREAIQPLEYLVSTLSTFESADPRDTVNALRNIARESMMFRSTDSYGDFALPPEPDYGKDLLEVYTDFVRWVVNTSGRIDILCRHWAIPERDYSDVNYPRLVTLPSWILQISESPWGRQKKMSRGRINGDSFVGMPGHGSYNASHNMKARVRFPQDTFPSESSSSSNNEVVPEPPVVVVNNGNGVSTVGNSPVVATPPPPAHSQFDAEMVQSPYVLQPSMVPSTKEKLPQTSEASLSQAKVTANISAGKRPREDEARGSEGSEGSSTKKPRPSLRAPFYRRLSSYNVKVPFNAGSNSRKSPRSSAPPSPGGLDSPTDSEPTDEFPRIVQHKTGRDASIYIDGLQIGTVTWATNPIADGVILDSALKKLRQGSSPDSLVPDKLWRTLVAERGADGRNPPPWYFRACYHCVVNESPNGHINTRELLAQSQQDIVRDFLKRVQAVTWNRCFLEVSPAGPKAKQKSLLHGLGPSRAREGDLLCILFGCSVPVILRKHSDRVIGEFYSLVGECYIYGIMDGEIVSAMKEPDIEKKKKTFRVL